VRSTLAFAAFSLGAAVCAFPDTAREKAIQTSVCALYSHSRDYDGHRVTVPGRLTVSTYTLQSEKCPDAHVFVELARSPDPALCQHAPVHAVLGCPGDERKFIDGTFSGVFRASSDGVGGRLRLESVVSFFAD
jgi:hypothetical protein